MVCQKLCQNSVSGVRVEITRRKQFAFIYVDLRHVCAAMFVHMQMA